MYSCSPPYISERYLVPLPELQEERSPYAHEESEKQSRLVVEHVVDLRVQTLTEDKSREFNLILLGGTRTPIRVPFKIL